MTTKDWKEIAASKQRSVLNAIPLKWTVPGIKDDMISKGYVKTSDYLDLILGEFEVSITKQNVAQLQQAIESKKLTAVQVTEAFCHRAALTHQIVNCCSEIFFDEAIERANELDAYLKENGKTIGPLHGIPISLKDQVDLPGKDSSIGFCSLVDHPKSEYSLLAKNLLDQGAVFYVKTTVPMAMMAPETVSNVFGYTYNSVNINLSAGGSSGGEGALIAAGASPLGFGTDIGGSIRIPSSFHGLYALKPSSGRISYLNVTNSVSGQECMRSVIGPMGRSLEDVTAITKLVVNSELWKVDPKVLHVPWKNLDSMKNDKFVFGMWRFDTMITPHPPVLRALEETAQKLRSQGHEVIDIELPDPRGFMDTANKIYGADSGFELASECRKTNEPVVPVVRKCVSDALTEIPATVNQWWDICNEAYLQRQAFLKFWENTAKLSVSGKPIDAIISPVWPTTSSLPDGPPTINYTAPFNLCDCASVVVPVTNVSSELDKKSTNFVPIDQADQSIQDSFDADLVDNMPVCVQVVTKKLEEEKALLLAEILTRN